jgi:hypothetical protein
MNIWNDVDTFTDEAPRLVNPINRMIQDNILTISDREG